MSMILELSVTQTSIFLGVPQYQLQIFQFSWPEAYKDFQQKN